MMIILRTAFLAVLFYIPVPMMTALFLSNWAILPTAQAAEDAARSADTIHELAPKVLSLTRQAKRDSKSVRRRAAQCASDKSCPTLSCSASAELMQTLEQQLALFEGMHRYLKKLSDLYNEHHINLLKQGLQTGKNKLNVQRALAFQRPLLEFGGSMLDIASVMGGITSISSVDDIYELVKDLDSAYSGIQAMLIIDIEKAYSNEEQALSFDDPRQLYRKAKALHDAGVEFLDRQLGIGEGALPARRDEANQMLQALARLKQNTTDVSGFNTFKSDASNVKGIVESVNKLKGLAEYGKRKLNADTRKLLNKGVSDAKSDIRIAALSMVARHLKDIAVADMKERIARMQQLAKDLAAEDKVVAGFLPQVAEVRKLRFASEDAVKAVKKAIEAHGVCRESRRCSASLSDPGVSVPEQFPTSTRAVAYFVGELEKRRGKPAEARNLAFPPSDSCRLNRGPIPALPAATSCLAGTPVPKPPKLASTTLASTISCDKCKATQQLLKTAQGRLSIRKAAFEEVQGRLNRVLTKRQELLSEANDLSAQVSAKADTGLGSFDPTSGIRIEATEQGDGTVQITTTYPDGRKEVSSRSQSSSGRLLAKSKALREQAKKLPDLRATLRQRSDALGVVQSEVDALQQSYERCSEQCQTPLKLVDRGDGVYALPQQISPQQAPLLLRPVRQVNSIVAACDDCASTASQLRNAITSANATRRTLSSKAAEFEALMSRAEANLRKKSQSFSFTPKQLKRSDLCELLGEEAAENVLARQAKTGRLKTGGATRVVFSASTAKSPSIQRAIRKTQMKAIKLLPDINILVARLAQKDAAIAQLRDALRQCEADRCTAAGLDRPLLRTQRTYQAFSTVCVEACGALERRYNQSANRLRNALDQHASLVAEQLRLSEIIASASESGLTTTQIAALNSKRDEIDIRLRRKELRSRVYRVEAAKLQVELDACIAGRCPATPASGSPPYPPTLHEGDDSPDGLLSIELVRVIPASGNNPMDTTDPVAETASGLTSSSTTATSTGTTVNFLQNCIGRSLTSSNPTVSTGVVIFASQSANNCEFFINTGGGESALPLVLIVFNQEGFSVNPGYDFYGNGTTITATPSTSVVLAAGFVTDTRTTTVTVDHPDDSNLLMRFTLDTTLVEGNGTNGGFDIITVTIVNAEVL